MTDSIPELDTTSPFKTYHGNGWKRLIWRFCDWRGFSAERRQRLRKRYARKIKGPFDVSYKKMKFRLYPAENYCDRVIFGRKKLPENREHKALRPHIKPGMVFVDIGANVGSYSIFVGTRAKGDVTLFGLEPHPRTFQKLVYNLQANNLPIEHIINCGAGLERGERDLWSDGGSNIGHTSMLKAGTANPKISVAVPVAPLAELLSEHGITKIDLLKIDIEGFEDRALAPFLTGASPAMLPKHILIETSHQDLWKEDLLKILQSKAYWKIFETKENQLWARA